MNHNLRHRRPARREWTGAPGASSPLRIAASSALKIAALGLCLASGSTAYAVELTFEDITFNNGANAGAGESQILLDLVDDEPGFALMTFKNFEPVECSVARIFLDGDSVLGIDSILNSPGVAFEEIHDSRSLPGGQAIDFYPEFRLAALSPPPINGINPGEELDVRIQLRPGISLEDLLGEVFTGGFRVGLHVIACEHGGSGVLVNRMPEPGTMLLLLLIAVTCGAHRRRRPSF